MTHERMERQLLEREKADLAARLVEVAHDNTLGVIEKSAERRALRARMTEIDAEMDAYIPGTSAWQEAQR